jgi:short-subunit dehydrogenase
MFTGRESLRGKTAVVTGAVRGLGFALAENLAAEGADLVLVDIDGDGLDEARARLSDVTVVTHSMDVGQWRDWEGLRARLEADSRKVDILINNAGVAYGGRFVATDLEAWRRVIDVNLWGVIFGCYAFLPQMYENKAGQVLNVASISGLLSTGAATPYATSKFGVVGLSEGLRAEAAVHSVSVTVACPDFVLTEIADRAVDDTSGSHEYFQAQLARATGRHGIPASTAARRIIRGMKRDQMAYAVRRWMPRTWDRVCRWMARHEAKSISRWRAQHPERSPKS